MNEYKAKRFVRQRDYFGTIDVKHGDTDGLIIGFSKNYTSVLRPVLEVIEKDKGVDKVAAMMMILSEKNLFSLQILLSIKTYIRRFVNIAKMAEFTVKSFAIEPRIAMLGFENFAAISETSKKVAKAVSILHEKYPKMIVMVKFSRILQ
jgi:malate dehydrogenase (oxaloacetate-decarboxylating)(NADP+)